MKSKLFGALLSMMTILVLGISVTQGFVTQEVKIYRNNVPVQAVQQLATNWCWAASDFMVLRYYQSASAPSEQCHVVGRSFNNGEICCNPNNANPNCNSTGFSTFFNYGLRYDLSSHSLDWNSLVSGFNDNKPLIFTWIFPGNNGGHIMVGSGYYNDGENLRVWRNDPLTGTSAWITYGQYYGYPYTNNQTGGNNYSNIRP
ncbi:MAG: papain-like cysteine protease family protein [Fibrobacteria bacterium]